MALGALQFFGFVGRFQHAAVQFFCHFVSWFCKKTVVTVQASLICKMIGYFLAGSLDVIWFTEEMLEGVFGPGVGLVADMRKVFVLGRSVAFDAFDLDSSLIYGVGRGFPALISGIHLMTCRAAVLRRGQGLHGGVYSNESDYCEGKTYYETQPAFFNTLTYFSATFTHISITT